MTLYVGAVRPMESCSQGMWGETFGHLMQVEAGEQDDGA